MADDDTRPLIDPRLFAPSEFLGEDVEHNVDVTGSTNIEVEHTVDLDLPVRRIELAVVAFAVLVVAIGTFTAAAATVQVSAALGVVALGNRLVGGSGE